MQVVSSQKHNDCVLTAIATLTGKDYAEIDSLRNSYPQSISPGGGTYTSFVPLFMDKLGYRLVQVKGERPAINTPCLFRMAKGPRSKVGHLVAVIDGLCYEASGRVWNPRDFKCFQMECFYLYKKG